MADGLKLSISTIYYFTGIVLSGLQIIFKYISDFLLTTLDLQYTGSPTCEDFTALINCFPILKRSRNATNHTELVQSFDHQ